MTNPLTTIKAKLPTCEGTGKALAASLKHPATYATLFAIMNIMIPFLNRFAEAGAGFESAKDDILAFAHLIGTNATAWADAKNAACVSFFVPEAGRDPALAQFPQLEALADNPFLTGLARTFNGPVDYGTDIALGAVVMLVLIWNYIKTTNIARVKDLLADKKIEKRHTLLVDPSKATFGSKAIHGLREFGTTFVALFKHVPKLVWLYSAMILTINYLNIFFTDHELGYERAASQFCDASNGISVADDFSNPFDVIDVKNSINDLMKFSFAALSSAATIISPFLTLYLAAMRVPPTKENSEFSSSNNSDEPVATAGETTPLLGKPEQSELTRTKDSLNGCCAFFCLPKTTRSETDDDKTESGCFDHFRSKFSRQQQPS